MEDIPQPSDEPYSIGDHVRVYISEDDPDAAHHNEEYIIAYRFEDDLNEETGRPLDRYSYRVRPINGGSPIPIQFRHRDLVPVADE